MSKDLFGQLDATKIDFVLDLDYHNFEKQCFLINKLFMNYPKPPKTIQKQPKFIASKHKLLDISYNQPQISRDPQQPATKCIWLIFSSKILKLYSKIFPKSLKNNEYSDFQFYWYSPYYYYHHYRNISKYQYQYCVNPCPSILISL